MCIHPVRVALSNLPQKAPGHPQQGRTKVVLPDGSSRDGALTTPTEGTMDSQPITQVACVECGKPVPLIAAETNERGQAVHQECYDRRVQAEQADRTKAS
jgi:hypothetical protein